MSYYNNTFNANETGSCNVGQEAHNEAGFGMNAKDLKEFSILAPASIIYAIIFVFCLYKNFLGITNVVWTAATVGYIIYVSKEFKCSWKFINVFISVIIMLLGVSNFVTGNYTIIFFNYIAIICLIVANMMYLFTDEKKINVTQHLLFLFQLPFGSLVEIGAPFRQMKEFLKNRKIKRSDKMTTVIVGVIVAVPIFIIMLNILLSADIVFRETFVEMANWFSNFDTVFINLIGIGFMLVVGYIFPYILTKHANGEWILQKEGKCWENEPIIPIVVTGMVSVLYVFFSAIQIIYLFLGKGTLPDGYSYAEYAREGFFQLMFVSVFNAIMVLVCIEFFKKNRILKGILTIVSVCTFVMIVSSAYRMSMYISEYGLTFTRVFVLWALVVITLIVAGLLIYLYKEKFNLFQYSLVVVSVCFIVLSLSHIDYYIAKYDLSMYEEMNGLHEDDLYGYNNYVDYNYLMSLSTDAAPVIKSHEDEIQKYMEETEQSVDEVNWTYNEKITLRNFNVSRYIARLSTEK